MDCVSVPFRGWMGKTTNLSAFGTGYGSRCQTHRFESRTATLLGFSSSTVSSMYQEWSSTRRTSNQLDTTMGSIRVNVSQHPRGKLSTFCRVRAPTNWGCSEGKGLHLNIRKVFLMFSSLRCRRRINITLIIHQLSPPLSTSNKYCVDLL